MLPEGEVCTGRTQLPCSKLVMAQQDGLRGYSFTAAPPPGLSWFDMVLQLSGHPLVVLTASGPRLPNPPEMGMEA